MTIRCVNPRRRCFALPACVGLLLAACLLPAHAARAQTISPTAFTYQGQLTENGVAVTGTRTLLFRVYNSATSSTLLDSYNAGSVSVTAGLFNAYVDFGVFALGASGPRWLELVVNGTTLSPRQPLTGAPYALGLALPIDESAAVAQAALVIDNSMDDAIWCTSTATSGFSAGVRGQSHSSDGDGVHGSNFSATGQCHGVNGDVESPDGFGVFGTNSNTGSLAALGAPQAGVYAQSPLTGGYAGYFLGRGYFNDNVGINATNPQAPLQVAGGTDATLSGGGNIIVGTVGGANLVFDNNEIIARNNGTASSLFLNVPGGSVGIGTSAPAGLTLAVNGTAGKPGGGSWSSFSDARLKKNIQPLSGSLESLMKLKGVTFEYIDPAAIHELPGRRTGMLAQDIERVFPDWVEAAPDGMKRVTYRGFEALTVEALRDLRAEKDRQIESLKAENTDLRARLDRLEKLMNPLSTLPSNR